MGAETRAGGRAVDLAIRFSKEWLMNWYRKHALQPSELEFWRRLFGYKYSRQSRCTFYLTISAHLSSPEFSAPASWAAKASGFAGRLNIAEVPFGHDGEGHEWLLNRAELDNREADYREHPLSALKSHRPEG
jgi:hypothetical protein